MHNRYVYTNSQTVHTEAYILELNYLVGYLSGIFAKKHPSYLMTMTLHFVVQTLK